MKARSEKFKADTHYNHWLGTVALDSADIECVRRKFKDVINDENILGVDAYCLPSSDPKRSIEVYVTVYTGSIDLDKFGYRVSKAYPLLKEYKKEMTLDEFYRLFKRINLTFSFKNTLGTGKIKIEE